jgi:proline iminopeptidase
MKKYQLWPDIKPFDEGFLPVSNIHSIHYALYGNPAGIPVFFLHGGPGGGCSEDDARWFNPEKYHVILHDQRGSGKSAPLAETKENTSQDLVNDIEKLRLHLKIKPPVSLFGGSWGSTLALLYAQSYPQNVNNMMLRGIFTCTYTAQDYFYSQNGAGSYFPEAWNRLVKNIPPGADRVQERLYRLIEESGWKLKKKWCRLLAEYEYAFFNLPENEMKNLLDDFETYYPEMRLNMYYQANRFFLADRQILNNAYKIKHIPVTLIHGTEDTICPSFFALELHGKLECSDLILVEGGGHLSTDPAIKQALLKSLDKWH